MSGLHPPPWECLMQRGSFFLAGSRGAAAAAGGGGERVEGREGLPGVKSTRIKAPTFSALSWLLMLLKTNKNDYSGIFKVHAGVGGCWALLVECGTLDLRVGGSSPEWGVEPIL